MGIPGSIDRQKQCDAAKSQSDKQPKAVRAECSPKVEYVLVELVEVVGTLDLWVKGPGMDCTDSKFIPKSVKRSEKDKDGANFKQFINLSRNITGKDEDHPEYGREIFFRARIKEKNGDEDKLAGIKVNFEFKRFDGPNRVGPLWDGIPVRDAEQEGFYGMHGKAVASSQTLANGWTDPPVMLLLSAYGGDEFKISCKLDPAVPGASGSKGLETRANYVVWRRFWYQMTYAEGKEHEPPPPTGAEKNYNDVKAEMLWANNRTFNRLDFPPDLRDRTFYKEYMLDAENIGSAKMVVNVGDGSNLDEFGSNPVLMKTKEPAEHPIKENLIICEYQCDPKGQTRLGIYRLYATGDDIVLDKGDGGPIICKPALKAGANLVVRGEWGTQGTPWVGGGPIADDNIIIHQNRTNTLSIRVNLPVGAPVPTPVHPVFVRLQLESAKGYVGGATEHGIISVYQKDKDGEPCDTSGSKQNFNCTVAHEFGHKWNQTPEPGEQPKSLKDHPLQYVAHGGLGSHCMHGAIISKETLIPSWIRHLFEDINDQKPSKPGVDWQDSDQDEPELEDGNCTMFHGSSSKCRHKFCLTCTTYLQLQDMRSFKEY